MEWLAALFGKIEGSRFAAAVFAMGLTLLAMHAYGGMPELDKPLGILTGLTILTGWMVMFNLVSKGWSKLREAQESAQRKQELLQKAEHNYQAALGRLSLLNDEEALVLTYLKINKINRVRAYIFDPGLCALVEMKLISREDSLGNDESLFEAPQFILDAFNPDESTIKKAQRFTSPPWRQVSGRL